MSHVSRVLDIPTEKLYQKADPIDLLISINHPSFHVEETRVKDGLVARRSPFGWVVFGSNSDDALPEAEQVLHVCLAEPVDINEFWKTDSMGMTM